MSHIIGGDEITGSGAFFHSENPASGERLWSGCAATALEVDAAVLAARHAFADWSAREVDERAHVLRTFEGELKLRAPELAAAISAETGKPRWEAATEVQAMAGKIALSIAAYAERSGSRTGEVNGIRSRLRHRPHGVLAVFGPYNFPGHLPNGHIVPALLAGNTVVFKPSELTPWVAELTLDAWIGAGLPDGVINLLQGGRDTGAALAAHAGIDGLCFTGSHATGQWLHHLFAGQTGKLLALELGGNNPLLVDAEAIADLDAAAWHVVQSAYLSAGQRCTCARRLIVAQGAAGDAFIARLLSWIDGIRVAAASAEPEPFMGPVIDNRAADGLLAFQQRLSDAGGRILRQIRRLEAERPLLTPGLIDVSHTSDVPDEEAFGPLLQLIRVRDFSAAIHMANRTRFGLAAGLLSDDATHWAQFQREIRAGIVNWNRPTTGAASAAPFGGIGDSGNLRPSAYYAADYCAWPMASLEADRVERPAAAGIGLQVPAR